MVVVGVPEKKTPIGVATLITGHRSLAGSAIGSIKETQEMLEFCNSHNIRVT
jgi:alcohol dehydrogenase (NADP+)